MKTIKDNEVILGDITFLEQERDGEYKAIVHKVRAIISCNNPDHATEIGEKYLKDFESYLVPSLYNGKIVFEENDYQLESKPIYDIKITGRGTALEIAEKLKQVVGGIEEAAGKAMDEEAAILDGAQWENETLITEIIIAE